MAPGNGNGEGASSEVKAAVVLIVLAVWTGSFIADVTLAAGYDTPMAVHAIAFGVFGWALGGKFVTDWTQWRRRDP